MANDSTIASSKGAEFRRRFLEFWATHSSAPGLPGRDLMAQYSSLVKRLALLVDAHVLRDGQLILASDPRQGCPRALRNAANGTNGPTHETARALCFRTLGFVACSQTGWRWPGRNGEDTSEFARAQQRRLAESFARLVNPVLSAATQERIWKQCKPSGAPDYALLNDVENWVVYLRHHDSEKPGRACWEESPFDDCRTGELRYFEHARAYLRELLPRVARAKEDVIFVAVSLSISVHQGHDSFITALKNSVRLRFLVFDVVNGDIDATARNLGLPRSVVAQRCVDTIEAFKVLFAELTAANYPGQLEVRLFDREPGLRLYAIDQQCGNEGLMFFCPRTAQQVDGPGFLLSAGECIAEFYAEYMRRTWEAAKPWAKWIDKYEEWFFTPAAQDLLKDESCSNL